MTTLINSKPLPKSITQDSKTKSLPNAGPKWFNMVGLDQSDPSTQRSIQILKARSVLDTKKFYKKTEAPGEFNQLGTIINGAGDVGRLTRKEQGRELVEELMKDDDTRQKLKERFGKVQQHRMTRKSKQRKSLFRKRK